MVRAEVFITLKPVVNDPAGLTIRSGLHALGFGSVSEVRSGKYLVLTLDEPDPEKARHEVDAMARQLLANEVIEDYRINLLESSAATASSPLRGTSGRGS
jgi:phosphoribosylformylglycinamidine synthase subunit PurS